MNRLRGMDFARFCRLTLVAAVLGSLSAPRSVVGVRRSEALYMGKRHVKAEQVGTFNVCHAIYILSMCTHTHIYI